MSGKRGASSDLNHDNWDQDDEPEDAGVFQRASEESLQRRIIKTARRRNPISSVRSQDTDRKSAFAGFTAFSKTSAPTIAPFPFVPNVTNPVEQPKINGSSENVEKSVLEKDASKNKTLPVLGGSIPTNIPKVTNKKSNDYFSKLKGLNESVSNWIKKHVDKNPLINLQPIFKDYEKYFKDLEKEEGSKSNTDMKNMNTAENIPDDTTEKTRLESDKSSNKSKYSFEPNCTSGPAIVSSKPSYGFSSTATSNTFSFASSNISTSTMSTLSASFSLGSNASTPSSTGFSFSGLTPFTFSGVQPSSVEESNQEKDAGEDSEPPKVEFIPVVEKDHIYTTRCKVFVKKDGSYGDRGVGNLYLKPIEDSEKVQLIVRADTSLGNLLCNFILSENIPTKRMGKKDVMLVCLPTPDVKPPPVTLLLRVKSSEEADNLLEILEKHKK
ncbi:hypothetical protein NQ314_020386 [Rhamnusium bicolor]|uniref:RanBD1 domain-containing protein n=1 Tax=Rhamnusium bicolor TaxID=1586634 RepID=A0AAV8WKV1_9CUCU|nr:hypothetical protein NQ314_020386 [Rhamnusium bicolor]